MMIEAASAAQADLARQLTQAIDRALLAKAAPDRHEQLRRVCRQLASGEQQDLFIDLLAMRLAGVLEVA